MKVFGFFLVQKSGKFQITQEKQSSSSLVVSYTHLKYIPASVGYCLFELRFSRTSVQIAIDSTLSFLLIAMVHMGKLIEAELRKQERSVTWFAKKLYCDRTNIYSIFKRESIDTQLLLRICNVLNYNFFNHYTIQLQHIDNEPHP